MLKRTLKKLIMKNGKIDHEVMFHACGLASMLALLPLLFFFHRDEHNAETEPLEDMIHSVDFKVMVYVSLAAAFPLTADLIIDLCTIKNFIKRKQMIPRVAICGTLLGTAFLHLYFTLHLGSVFATWVIMNTRAVMSCAVLLYQCHIRCGHVVTPAYTYFLLFCWNVGSIVKCYGGNLSITLLLGQYMRFAAIMLALWGLIEHMRMYFNGKLKSWYSKWQRTFFELLFIVTISIGVLATTLYSDQNMMYNVSPTTMLIISYDAVMFLVLMSIIITNEYRHVHAQAQIQLEVKRMFVKYVSHEVRTPLNSCMLGIQYMKDAIRQPTEESIQEIAGILDEVSEGCNTAIDFMNNLLLYEKIDSMDLPMYLKKEDITTVCTEALQSFKMSARQLGVTLKLKIHDDILKPTLGGHTEPLLTANVEIDGPKVVIVLRNLMSNALKFTPENGEISLSVIPIRLPVASGDGNDDDVFHTHQDPRDVEHLIPKSLVTGTTHFRVILSDSGKGMALEDQLQLFTNIVQFSPNEAQKGGGSGIGLYLSHHIMSDHHLKIQVYSEGVVSNGTHFFIDFPRLVTEAEKKSNMELLDVTAGEILNDNNNLHNTTFNESPNQFVSSTIQSILATKKGSPAKIAVISSRSSTGGDACFSASGSDEDEKIESSVDTRLVAKQKPRSDISGRKHATVDPFNRKQSSSILSKIVTPQNEAACRPTLVTNKRLENLTVLVVDDSALNCKMLIRTLNRIGVGKSFESVNDGVKLLAIFGLNNSDSDSSSSFNAFHSRGLKSNVNIDYDVIILDDHMTDIDGSVAIKILRLAGYDGLVVGLTGSAMDEDLNAFCAAGVDYALPKPFVIDDFVHILKCNFGS